MSVIHYKEKGERYILCGKGGFKCSFTSIIKDVKCESCKEMLEVRGLLEVSKSQLIEKDVVWDWYDTPSVKEV